MKWKQPTACILVLLATAVASCIVYEKWLQEAICEFSIRAQSTPLLPVRSVRLLSPSGTLVAELKSYDTSKFDETLRQNIQIHRIDGTNIIFAADFFSRSDESSLESNVAWEADGLLSFTKLPASAFINRSHWMQQETLTGTAGVKKMSLIFQ